MTEHKATVEKASKTTHRVVCVCGWKQTKFGGPDNGYSPAVAMGKTHVNIMSDSALLAECATRSFG